MVKKLQANAGDLREMGLIPGSRRSPGGRHGSPHSSIPAQRIPWTEEPGGLQSTGWLRVRYHWSYFACAGTKVTMFPFLIPQSITHCYLSNRPAQNKQNSFIAVRKEHHRVLITGRAGLNLIQPAFLISSLSVPHCHSMSSWTISFQFSKAIVT